MLQQSSYCIATSNCLWALFARLYLPSRFLSPDIVRAVHTHIRSFRMIPPMCLSWKECHLQGQTENILRRNCLEITRHFLVLAKVWVSVCVLYSVWLRRAKTCISLRCAERSGALAANGKLERRNGNPDKSLYMCALWNLMFLWDIVRDCTGVQWTVWDSWIWGTARQY